MLMLKRLGRPSAPTGPLRAGRGCRVPTNGPMGWSAPVRLKTNLLDSSLQVFIIK
jgi:hypothetical protein